MSENALSFVKLTVYKLIFEQVVPMALAHKLGIGLMVRIYLHLNLLSECLLDRVKFNQILLQLSLVFDPLGRMVVFFEPLELVRKVVHLIELVRLLDVKMRLMTGSSMAGYSLHGDRSMLLRIIRVPD